MGAVVVDTTVLIEYKDTGGPRSGIADEIVRGIDDGTLPTGHVTDSVVLETLNWLHERRRHDIAVDLRRRLAASDGFAIVHTAERDYRRAVDLFETYDGLAFGDAIVFAYAERAGVDYCYSFDDDFDTGDGLTRLETATNPFA